MTIKECVCVIEEDLKMFPSKKMGGENIFFQMRLLSLRFG